MKRMNLFLLAGLLSLTCACQSEEMDTDTLRVYYSSTSAEQTSALTSMRWDGDENVETLFTALKTPPVDGSATAAVPSDTEILSWTVDDGVLTLDLSSGYGTLSGVRQTMANYCIVLTCTQLDGVDEVRITVEGESVTEHEVLRPEDVMLDGGEGDTGQMDVRLWYPQTEGGMGSEEVSLQVTEDRSRVETLLQGLCAEPTDHALTDFLPDNVSDITLWMEDGVCYVNLTEEWAEELEQNAVGLHTALQCIVDTMCQLEDVDAVQFLMDGAAMEQWSDMGGDFPLYPSEVLDNGDG